MSFFSLWLHRLADASGKAPRQLDATVTMLLSCHRTRAIPELSSVTTSCDPFWIGQRVFSDAIVSYGSSPSNFFGRKVI